MHNTFQAGNSTQPWGNWCYPQDDAPAQACVHWSCLVQARNNMLWSLPIVASNNFIRKLAVLVGRVYNDHRITSPFDWQVISAWLVGWGRWLMKYKETVTRLLIWAALLSRLLAVLIHLGLQCCAQGKCVVVLEGGSEVQSSMGWLFFKKQHKWRLNGDSVHQELNYFGDIWHVCTVQSPAHWLTDLPFASRT